VAIAETQEIGSLQAGENQAITSSISVLAFQKTHTLSTKLSTASTASGTHLSLNKNKIPKLQLLSVSHSRWTEMRSLHTTTRAMPSLLTPTSTLSSLEKLHLTTLLSNSKFATFSTKLSLMLFPSPVLALIPAMVKPTA